MFRSEQPEARLHSLLFFLDHLKVYHDPTGSVQILVDFLEYEYFDEIREIEAMIANDDITFHALWYLFKKGSKYAYSFGEKLIGSTVKSTNYELNLFGGSFSIDVIIHSAP